MKAGMKRSYEQCASIQSEATLAPGEPSRAIHLTISPERKNYGSLRTKAPETRVVRSLPFSHDDDSSVSGEESGDDFAESQTLKRTKVAMVRENSIAPGATSCTHVDGSHVIMDHATSHRRSFAVVCSSNMNRSMMAHKVLKSNNMSVRSFGVGRCLMLPSGNPRQPRCFGFGTPYAEMREALVEEDEATYRRNGVLGLLDRNAAIKTAPERWQNLPDTDVASFDVVVCVEQHVFAAVLEGIDDKECARATVACSISWWRCASAGTKHFGAEAHPSSARLSFALRCRRCIPPSPRAHAFTVMLRLAPRGGMDGLLRADYRSRRDLLEFKDICVVLMPIKDTIRESAAASGDVLGLCRMLEEPKDLNENIGNLLQKFSLKSSRKLQHLIVYV